MSHNWTIVTVTYNSSRHLLSHWRSNLASWSGHWIVVDNASSDASAHIARKLGAQVVRSEANRGFAAANNLGLAKVSTDYVIFVNPDVSMGSSIWQEELALTAETNRGLVAPQLLNPDGGYQANARGLPFLSAKIRNRVAPNSTQGELYAQSGFDYPVYCSWVMGAAVGGLTRTFREIGGWSEDYFLYYEDHELGLRAWQRGLSVVVNPAVKWTHEWQRETTALNWRAWRAELRSMRRFYHDHPEFLGGSPRSRRSVQRIERAGYGQMRTLLWTRA